jgi:hypothetical protein
MSSLLFEMVDFLTYLGSFLQVVLIWVSFPKSLSLSFPCILELMMVVGEEKMNQMMPTQDHMTSRLRFNVKHHGYLNLLLRLILIYKIRDY